MATSVNNPAWLEWMTGFMGGVSRQTCAATFPQDHYFCLVDELPLHLLPGYARNSLDANSQSSGPLILNPECEFRVAGDIPTELGVQEDIRRAFALQGTIAWVRDALTGSLLPFWLGPELEAVVDKLRDGEPIPSTAATDKTQLLAAAGILVSPTGAALRMAERDEVIRNAAALFREKGYAPLARLIHPFHVAALRRYYRCLTRKGRIQLGDAQSPLRYVIHNEPVARFFHRQIANMLRAVVGESIKPSYVYLASYLAGAELEKHTDREQCEFSITLCLDFSPEPEVATSWPIHLDTSDGTVTVYQALGDGLAYRGTRLPHYRDKLATGHTSTSIFFHYVAEKFAGPLN